MLSAVKNFTGSMLNPWHNDLSLKTDFSMKYGKVTALSNKAGKIHNTFLKTVAKVAAFVPEALATLFYNALAFLVNNTYGFVQNKVAHYKNNKEIAKNNTWKIKNPKAIAIDAALVGTAAVVALNYFGVISVGGAVAKLFAPKEEPSILSTIRSYIPFAN